MVLVLVTSKDNAAIVTGNLGRVCSWIGDAVSDDNLVLGRIDAIPADDDIVFVISAETGPAAWMFATIVSMGAWTRAPGTEPLYIEAGLSFPQEPPFKTKGRVI